MRNAASATTTQKYELKVASANVLSLLPKGGPAGIQGKARMEMLQAQFATQHYHIVGLQETRVRTEIKVDQEEYLVFSAPATAGGHYGCQIWISTTIPLGANGACLQKQHCKIVAKDPRFLVIQINAPFLRTLVISAHAPTSQMSAEVITKWWEKLDAQVPHRLRQWPQILLVDANARVGSQPSSAVGPHQADEQDIGGEEFHGYLLSHQLWAPATFDGHQEGDAGTWKHPRTDEWSRGDYVCLPRYWTLQDCRAFIEKEVDISLTREDHQPPAVAISWTATTSPEGHQPRRNRNYDVSALRYDLSGENHSVIMDSLQQDLRSVPWSFDVHTHTEILQRSMQQWMTKWYSKRRKHPKRPHMSPATWNLVMEKQQIRKELFQAKADGQRRLLRGCFNCWANKTVEDDLEAFSDACAVALKIKSFQTLGRRVTAALRQDDRNYFAALAQQVGDNDSPGKCNQIWQSIKWMLPKARGRRGNNPLLMETLDNQWIPHFAKLEAGVPTTATTLVGQCTARQQAGETSDLPQLADLPTRFEIEQILLRLQANKAAGPDGLPGDLYRAAAPILAAPLHDIICKTVCWNAEAVQNKGGVMYPIHKKGSQQCAENYRGIMLLNVSSKILHSWVRSRLINRLDQIRPDTQIGGFRNQQVTYGSHCVQLVAKLAHQRQVPMSCIFLDVQGAYHFLIRDLVIGASPPEDVDRILQNLQEWNIDQRGVKQWMKLPGILERMHFPATLVKLLREIHLDTWARLPHLDEVLRTTKGSRPGSPLADAVYAALMLDIHVEVDRILAESTNITEGYEVIQTAGFAVTWADDLAIPVVTVRNEDLVPEVLWVVKKVHAAFERRGLLLNMSKGKTTAVLAFRGKDAPKFRREFLLTSDPGVELHLANGKHLRLHFCSAYRHLGAIFITDGEVTSEVASRLGQARSSYHLLKRNLFGNRRLSVYTRLKLFEALIVSKLCFGICTWGHIQARSWQSLESFVSRAQRYIYNGDIGGITAQEIMGKYKIPTFQQRISSARLKYAVRVFLHGPSTLAELLEAEDEVSPTSWWKHVNEDLKWCNSLLDGQAPADWNDRASLIKSWKLQSSAWWKYFRKVYRISLLQEAIAADARYWHGQVAKVLVGAGEAIENLQIAGTQEQGHHCHCGRSFDTIQGLTAHRRLRRNYVAPEALMVGDAVSCPHCLKYLWTPARVKQHLSYIPRGGGGNPCYNALLRAGYKADTEENESPAIALGSTKGINRRDALQAQGPRLQPRDLLKEMFNEAQKKETEQAQWFANTYDVTQIDLEMVERYSAAYTETTQAWFQGLAENSVEEPAIQALQDEWLDCIQEDDSEDDVTLITVHWGREILPDIAQQWMSGYAENWAETAFYDLLTPSNFFRDEEELQRLQGRLRHLHRRLQERSQDPESAHREARRGPQFHRGSNRQVRGVQRRYADSDGWHEGWTKATLQGEVDEVRLPFYQIVADLPTYLIVHLFSGRRRADDFHAHIQQLSGSNPHFRIHVLSLDTAVHEEYGNLSWTSVTWKNLLSLLQGGRVAAAIAGPPCETWSAARYNQPDPEVHGPNVRWPRPLRDASRPWGIEGLKPRELRQLYTGSQLGLQTLLVMAYMIITGGLYLKEHPSPSPDEWKASIFRTPIVRLMLQHSVVSLFRFSQGDWGALSEKPTSLLTVRLRHLPTAMLRWRRPTPRDARISSIGKDKDGKFRTSHLKEYPTMFAKGMAQAIYDGIRKRHQQRVHHDLRRDDADLSSWVQLVLEVSETIHEDADYLPDYQPQPDEIRG